MPVLTLQNGERAGAAFPFDRPVVLGRGRRADIVVDDPSASRRHAQIELHGREWQLNDLDSANGTHLNGRPISRPTTIRPGDLIGIGGLTFRYEPDGKKETPGHGLLRRGGIAAVADHPQQAGRARSAGRERSAPGAGPDPPRRDPGHRVPGARGPRLRPRRAAQGGAAGRARTGAGLRGGRRRAGADQHPRSRRRAGQGRLQPRADEAGAGAARRPRDHRRRRAKARRRAPTRC